MQTSMHRNKLIGKVVGLILVGVVTTLVVGQLLGQPILLSYVETGSMEPTLRPGDGFIAIPMAIAGPVNEGDVIVFEAERLQGGGLTTHRVVDTTDQGYITKGDANPVTDQDGEEPPVQEAQIAAKALQIGGDVVVIPYLGLLVIGLNAVIAGIQQRLAILFGTRVLLGTQGLAYLLFAVGVLAYLASELLDRRDTRAGDHPRTRDVTRRTGLVDVRVLIAVMTLVLIVVVTMSMVVPSGSHQYGVVSSDTDAPGPRVIPRGHSEETTFLVPSNGVLPVVVFLEPGSDGIDVTPRELYVESRGQANATVTLHAPPENGYYRRFLIEHRYLALLPVSTIRMLYGIHPWLPIVAIDALVAVGFAGLAIGLVGLGPIRMRSGRDVSVTTRLRRWFR